MASDGITKIAAISTVGLAIPIGSGVAYYKKFSNKKTKHRGLKAVGVGIGASILASPILSILMLDGMKDLAKETQAEQERQMNLEKMKQRTAFKP